MSRYNGKACVAATILSLCMATNATAQDRIDSSCEFLDRESTVYRIRWDLNGSLLPCERTLQPHGVVVVIVRGANPAVARYRLDARVVREITPAGAQERVPASAAATTPSAPAPPTFRAEIGEKPQIVADVARQDTTAAGIAALDAARQSRMRELLVFDNARSFIQRVKGDFAAASTVSSGIACVAPSAEGAWRTDYWHIAQSVATLHRTVRWALDGVFPPVDRQALERSQSCIEQLEASNPWGALLARGTTIAARSFAESRAQVEGVQAQAATLRDALNGATLTSFNGSEQATLRREREVLLVHLAEISDVTGRILRHDFSEEGLTSIIASIQQASRWASVIRSSRAEALVEVALDGVRGRSKNIILAWEPVEPDIAVPAGTQTVLVDRFAGVLLNVSGSAGFAGIRKHEVLRKAAFSTAGALVPDTVQLIPNATFAWGPALSTGLSATHHWRNGFYVGGGIDLMVLTDDQGNATTRIAFPVLHLGRDDTRIFFGPILGASDSFAFSEDSNLRVPISASTPEHLIMRNRSAWKLHERLYIGVVVGQSSLDPTKLGNQ